MAELTHLHPAVQLYRKLNPQSRATDHTTTSLGSKVRKVVCIYCREVIATSASRWSETEESKELRKTHGEACAARYLKEISAGQT